MFLKNKLFLSVVLFVIGLPVFSSANSEKCQEIFTPGMKGYALVVDNYHKMNMKVDKKISAILEKIKINDPDWQRYIVSAEQFREEQARILDEKSGKVKPEYKGPDGQALYADKYHEGDMSKAYSNITAVLGGFRRIRELDLGWKNFQDSTSQYRALKRLFEVYGLEGLRDAEGYKKAAEIFKGHEERAYHNVSVLREQLLGSRSAFDNLNWIRH